MNVFLNQARQTLEITERHFGIHLAAPAPSATAPSATPPPSLCSRRPVAAGFDIHEVLHHLVLEHVALVLRGIRWQGRRGLALVEVDEEEVMRGVQRMGLAEHRKLVHDVAGEGDDEVGPRAAQPPVVWGAAGVEDENASWPNRMRV